MHGYEKSPAKAGECKGNYIQLKYSTKAEERKAQNERIAENRTGRVRN